MWAARPTNSTSATPAATRQFFADEQPEEEIREAAPDSMMNVGMGEDLSINDLMALIQDVVGHDGPVEHDHSKPDGTPRKLVDTSRLDALGWTAQTALREGARGPTSGTGSESRQSLAVDSFARGVSE